MKKIKVLILATLLMFGVAGVSQAANFTLTPNKSLKKPTLGLNLPLTDGDNYGAQVNANADIIDKQFFADVVTLAEFANFPAAVTALCPSGDSSPVKTLIIPVVTAVASNTTVCKPLTLEFTGSGRLDPATGIVVTINGPIVAPVRQIFLCLTTEKCVIFGPGFITEVPIVWFGAKDGNADDTDEINAAYNAAKTAEASMRVLPGTYIFTSKLLWDGDVNVLGSGTTRTILMKKGNFVGIEVNQTSQDKLLFADFTLDSLSGQGDVSTGMDIVLIGNNFSMERVAILKQGLHGIHKKAGNQSFFSTIQTVGNTGDGIRIEGLFASNPSLASNTGTYLAIDTRANGGKGFNIVKGDSNIGFIISQSNAVGFEIDTGRDNVFTLYNEAITGLDIVLTSNSVRNVLTMVNSDSVVANAISDAGTNNWILDASSSNILSVPNIGRLRPPTNATGRQLSITGGPGGPGSSGVAGGLLLLSGGDANGDTSAPGGDIRIQGGPGVNGGAFGVVRMHRGQDGGVQIGGTSVPSTSTILELQSTIRAFLPSRMTKTQMDALTAINGMLLYCSDCTIANPCAGSGSGAISKRLNGVWVCD